MDLKNVQKYKRCIFYPFNIIKFRPLFFISSSLTCLPSRFNPQLSHQLFNRRALMLAHPATVTEMLSSAQRNSCVTTKEIQIEFTYQKCSPLNRRLFVHLFWPLLTL